MGTRKLSYFQQCQNVLLMLTVCLPALAFSEYAFRRCSKDTPPVDVDRLWSREYLLSEDMMCSATVHHPLVAVNVIYFFNVNVIFWVISLIQGSTWLIDPYWTFIPVLIGMFYRFHPLATSEPHRAANAWACLITWAVRLTYSYFRREEWQVGANEDWRFTDMAQTMPRHWWWVKFWATYVSQQPMLVGLTLPLYAIHTSQQSWDVSVEQYIVGICLTGILIAHLADTQLRQFMVRNQERKQKGEPPVLLLDTGMWHYSRHPNYFGEQLFWLGLGLWAWLLGQKWMILGTIYNSLVMVKVTQMTEARMLANAARAPLYREYQRTTSVWVPWFKKRSPAVAAAPVEATKEGKKTK